MPAPPVSVVMPVRDGLPWLDDAVRSVLAQTYADFELVIVDDASTDGTADLLDAWQRRDPRVGNGRHECGNPARRAIDNPAHAPARAQCRSMSALVSLTPSRSGRSEPSYSTPMCPAYPAARTIVSMRR